MRSAAEYGLGLVLMDDEITPVVKAMGFDDEWELVESKETDTHCWRVYDDEMDGKTFSPLEGDEKHPDEMLVIWAKNQPTAFFAAYPAGYLQLETEMKNAVGKCLPKDFNWKAHLGYFSCVIGGL